MIPQELCPLILQGSNLDSNAKMWRLVADLMNDLGMLLLMSLFFKCEDHFHTMGYLLSRTLLVVTYGFNKPSSILQKQADM